MFFVSLALFCGRGVFCSGRRRKPSRKENLQSLSLRCECAFGPKPRASPSPSPGRRPSGLQASPSNGRTKTGGM
ncbi:hypothetical protein B0J13DRAFT_192179 [Dactylonectria estremocensis]|uniref:Secreted protein n=1 Tax=Dactylonectria estremocensis TaxID=1079267 RepID=A0A9P9FAE3_9HYPO|nr:hypothetical protein B0J13DRAFT_192179 [Dactylonectria estremocensis]